MFFVETPESISKGFASLLLKAEEGGNGLLGVLTG